MLELLLKFSIDNRYLVVLLSAGAAALGVMALGELPIDAVPDITNKQVQVNAISPGLSPVDVEKLVTFPIETALAGIPGLESTRSISRNGFAQVTAIFRDDVNIYFARQQVGERLSEARESLPAGVEPVMGPISTGLGEVYMWTVRFGHPGGKGAAVKEGEAGWQGDGTYLTPDGERLANEVERASYLRTVQDWIIRPQVKGLKDVAGVDAIGGYVKQFHVRPEPQKLISFRLTFHDVIEALERNNVSAGAGYVEHKGEAYVVRAEGRITGAREIEDIVLGSRGGTPIHVHDVATVGVGRELRTGTAGQNGQDAVVGTALMLVGANSRAVAATVDAKFADIRKSLPPDIEAETVLNRTTLVTATVSTVAKNLAEGALLVIVVLFLLLGNVRAAIITALAIPLSMLITSFGMVRFHISGNLMSLGAIDFGLIVDGAVIIVENALRLLAVRQHELGRMLSRDERLEVVRVASKQVLGAASFGVAIIIVVYVPILALTGIEGKMFHPMAMTVIFALSAAFVLSLTFIPAALAIAMTGRVKEKENVLMRLAKGTYAPLLRGAMGARAGVVALAIVLFAWSIALFGRLGEEFVPSLDEGDIAMHSMRIPSVSLTQSTAMQAQIERTLSGFPEVRLVFSKTGTAEMASDPMPPNVSDTFIMLRPRAEWPDPRKSKLALIREMEETLEDHRGHQYEFTQPIQMRFNELIAGVRGDVAIKVYGEDFDEMLASAERTAAVLREIPGSADVKVEQVRGLPVTTVGIDRDAISRLGLNVADVQDVISVAIGGREAGRVFQGDRRFDVVVRLPEDIRQDPESLKSLPVPLSAEHDEIHRPYLPLGDLADIRTAEGPNQISRENGRRRIVVQSNVRGRDLGSFVAEAQRRINGEVKRPPGTWLDWGGQFENMIAARERLAIVVPICLFLIFLLLFGTFNSVKHALLVFTGVPLALCGGVLALWIRDIPFSISAAIGFIALSGVAVLNGLVMITFINQLRAEGRSLEDSLLDGALIRLRPVLMTALVASLGFVPMALATGVGAEVQRPLATVVIGGLVSSTILTLLVLPALYRMFHREAAPGQR